MPCNEVPDFVSSLREKPETVGRLVLLFLYTAARTGEVRSARWSHVDIKEKLWNRPAELMKSRVSHSVTLNKGALAVLKRAALLRSNEADSFIFPNAEGDKISDMTISMIMRDMNLSDVPDGFRSSFTTGPPRIVTVSRAHSIATGLQIENGALTILVIYVRKWQAIRDDSRCQPGQARLASA